MENIVPSIFFMLFGGYCVFASRWIAQVAARQQSRFLSTFLRREIRLNPEQYRIPFVLVGIAFAIIEMLAASGVINFR